MLPVRDLEIIQVRRLDDDEVDHEYWEHEVDELDFETTIRDDSCLVM